VTDAVDVIPTVIVAVHVNVIAPVIVIDPSVDGRPGTSVPGLCKQEHRWHF
jgi:hypothetical protein